jgi:aspartate-semialdehyde dehydrogenase
MEELRQQTRDVLDGKPAAPKIFPNQYAFNLFSHNSPMDVASGYNEEEMKMVKETHKIWKNKDVSVVKGGGGRGRVLVDDVCNSLTLIIDWGGI